MPRQKDWRVLFTIKRDLERYDKEIQYLMLDPPGKKKKKLQKLGNVNMDYIK